MPRSAVDRLLVWHVAYSVILSFADIYTKLDSRYATKFFHICNYWLHKQLVQLVYDFYVYYFNMYFLYFLVYYAAYSPPMGVETDR